MTTQCASAEATMAARVSEIDELKNQLTDSKTLISRLQASMIVVVKQMLPLLRN